MSRKCLARGYTSRTEEEEVGAVDERKHADRARELHVAAAARRRVALRHSLPRPLPRPLARPLWAVCEAKCLQEVVREGSLKAARLGARCEPPRLGRRILKRLLVPHPRRLHHLQHNIPQPLPQRVRAVVATAARRRLVPRPAPLLLRQRALVQRSRERLRPALAAEGRDVPAACGQGSEKVQGKFLFSDRGAAAQEAPSGASSSAASKAAAASPAAPSAALAAEEEAKEEEEAEGEPLPPP